MKHYLVLAVASLLLFEACIKDDANNDVETTSNVTFNVSTLNVDYEPMTRAISDPHELGGKIVSIGYAVFRNGSRFSAGTQTYAEAGENFGKVTVAMPSGSCTVHFAGYGDGGANAYFTNYNGFGIYNEDRETFYGLASNVNLSNTTTYSVELARVTGAIAINITDAENAPADFVGIQLSYSFPTFWNLSGYSSEPSSITRTFSGSPSNFPNILIHCWPSVRNTLKMSVMATGNRVLKTKTIEYDVYANRKTVITGELFGGDQPFTVTINDAWDSDNVVDF